MLEYIKLSDYAKLKGLHYRTVAKHFHSGKLDGYISDTGRIYIKNPKYSEFVNKDNSNKVILYARVSSSINKDSLDGQIERMRAFVAAKSYEMLLLFVEEYMGAKEKIRLRKL